jgi:hypothetical protein
MPDDPYMSDKNIQRAAGMQVLIGLGLGAGLGFGAAGYFRFDEVAGALVGAVIGWSIAYFLLGGHSGRDTR